MTARVNLLRMLAGASAIGLSGAALAQTAPAAPATPASATPASAVSGADASNASAASSAPATSPQPTPAQAPAAEIVVTGSRVLKNGSASPTPLTTISTQALAVASPSGNISDALNNLPVFSGSRGQFSNPGSNATGVQGGNGAADVLNLRNLGFYRTLVLFDGHRIPPTLYNSAVDVDLIPEELIDRVDVVTGGVSAVYGSDAVSGVVNYVLNRKFNGFRAHVDDGVSQYGDGANRDFGGAFGTDVGSRGHFEMSAEHRENDGILNRAYDRSWDHLAALQGAGTAANPYALDTNVRLSTYSFGGLITSKGVLSGQNFGSNGTLSAFNKGTATGSSCCQIGGDGAYQDGSMISPSRSTQVFARFDYDLTDNIHWYFQGAANIKKNVSYSGWNQLSGVKLFGSNAYLPAAYQAMFAAAGQSTFTLNEIMKDAPRIQNVSNTHQYYVNTGLDGSLGDYKWSATYTHGASGLTTKVNNQVNFQRLTAVADAVVNPATGQVACEAALTDPSAYGNCVPINLFGGTSASSGALNYVLGTTGFHTETIQDSADASISGSPFHTWAGDVTIALSGEWRRQSFDATNFGGSAGLIDCTGLRNCSSTTAVYTSSFPSSPTVSQTVKEAAIEVEVPLVRDVRFIKSFDLNGAARYTDYSTSGHYATWKVGAVWQVDSDLKFRGTISRDIRAPTLYDLFQPQTTVYGNFTDVTKASPVTAFLPSINNGNPNLTAEVGHTYTVGAVYRPHFLPGTTLTVDYYHTIIDNAITTVQGMNAAVEQACAANAASPYCALIQRDAAGNVTAYYIEPENIAKVRTYGIDGEIDYATRIAGRPFSVRALINYQPHIYYLQQSVATIDQGDAGWGANGLMPSPSIQIAGFVDYQLTKSLSVDLFEHWRNKFRRSGVEGQVFVDPYVRSFATTNLTLTFDTGSAWKIKDSAFSLSVTNLFNAHPPLSGYYSGTTSAGQSYEFSDDPTGRAFLVGFRIKG